ncbi:alkaline phosphatase synthesis transcriptional regulatory protein PhoP [Paenibacillus glycanilyticus]|uniref:Alkaline phosphatase synthesis transcriptional regulatory protein PhoP n=1 Tax=Paenibacillus glycanilyticus TaxID=126569 RepID=A0ABQ6NRS5_9BACL|nr:response regulator transcription factor [Paenibacillus glycanilyticus]GMK47469.1 alkaline phosphatase synthesis transcriptional regulatory protein PhoP [Paenibacillus glycanilyticus]
MKKVLVVDDDFSISSAILYALEREGFTVETAGDGEEALEKAAIFKPHVMILDIMMPKLNGYDVYRKLSQKNPPGVLLLTAKNDIVDKVLGLELGADDYMTKPFDIREVLARVKALYRRKRLSDSCYHELGGNNNEAVIEIGGLLIVLYSRTVRMEDEELELTPKEFDLLVQLASNPEQVYSRKQLLNLLWDTDYNGGNRTVDIHVQRLRKKLGKWQKIIQTVNGIGYKIKVPPT